jgi:hypothetical protein
LEGLAKVTPLFFLFWTKQNRILLYDQGWPGTHVAWAALKLMITLFHTLECWNYRHMSSYQAWLHLDSGNLPHIQFSLKTLLWFGFNISLSLGWAASWLLWSDSM